MKGIPVSALHNERDQGSSTAIWKATMALRGMHEVAASVKDYPINHDRHYSPPAASQTKPAPVGGNSKILSQNAVHVSGSRSASDEVCTTLFGITFPSNAKLASVLALALYLGQEGAGDTSGFLAKDATIVWKVLDSCISDEVAVVRLNVPKITGTTPWGMVMSNKDGAKTHHK